MADGHAGLHILDVSDATHLKVVGRYKGPTEPSWGQGIHVCMSAKHVFLSDGSTDLRIVDVSRPAAPACVATQSHVEALDVAISNGRAYVATSDKGLVVLDPPACTTRTVSSKILCNRSRRAEKNSLPA